MTVQSKTPRAMPPQLLANAGRGRKRGVPNKTTRQVREAIALTLEQSADQLRQWLYAVGRTDPAKGLEMAIKLAQVATGKVRSEAEGFVHKNAPAPARAEISEPAKCRAVPQVSRAIAPARTHEAGAAPGVSARIAPARAIQSARCADAPPTRAPIVIPIFDHDAGDPAEPYNPT